MITQDTQRIFSAEKIRAAGGYVELVIGRHPVDRESLVSDLAAHSTDITLTELLRVLEDIVAVVRDAEGAEVEK